MAADESRPDDFFGTQLADERNRAPSQRRGSDPRSFGRFGMTELSRLRDSMEYSANRKKPFLDRHISAVQMFAGSRYGGSQASQKSALNIFKLAVEIWLRQLAAKTPKALVLTRAPDLKVDSYELEIATDFLLNEIRFGKTLSDTVRSAIFSMGVMKVGITSQYLNRGSSFLSEAGQPYAENVLFEDFLFDMNARSKYQWDWCGNRYRLPYDMVMQNPNWNSTVKNQLTTDQSKLALNEGHGNDSRSTNQMSAGSSAMRSHFRDYIDLWDIWIPYDNILVTIPDQSGLGPLEVKEWEGPEMGPFHVLSFSDVPGNVMPAAPAQALFEMQDLLTRIFYQIGQQAQRQKTITVVDGRAEADGTAERVMEAEDGAVIRASHIDGVKEMVYGGADQGNLAFVNYMKEMMSYLGGNIDSIGGLAQQAETLGQERLLAQSSSQMLQDMQAKVVDFSSSVIKDLVQYMYFDPLSRLPLVKQIKGFGDIPFTWGPENRKEDFFKYNFQVQPYSLQDKGPQSRINALMSLTSEFLLPLAPQLEQMGAALDLQKLMELYSKYNDLPEIEDLVVFDSPTLREQVDTTARARTSPGRSLQSPVTTRNYQRHSTSTGGTQQKRSQELTQSLLANSAKERK